MTGTARSDRSHGHGHEHAESEVGEWDPWCRYRVSCPAVTSPHGARPKVAHPVPNRAHRTKTKFIYGCTYRSTAPLVRAPFTLAVTRPFMQTTLAEDCIGASPRRLSVLSSSLACRSASMHTCRARDERKRMHSEPFASYRDCRGPTLERRDSRSSSSPPVDTAGFGER